MIQNTSTISAASSHFKVFVVGDYGTGKSIFASTFPQPGFVFDFDRGILNYRSKNFDYASYNTSPKDWIQFEKDLLEVSKLTSEGKYKTIIIDSTSTMTDLAMERALQIDPKRSPSNGPLWNVHYQLVKNLMEGRIRQVLNLQANIVVIGHLQVVKDEETGSIIDIQPLLTGQLSTKLPGYFDEVYCAFTRMKDSKVQYYLRTAPKGLYKARSRISGVEHKLPDEIPNDFAALEKALGL